MSKLIQFEKIFGHNHSFTGYADGTPYLHYHKGGGVTDGIGHQHIRLYATCDTCGKEIYVANIHVQSDGKIYGLDEDENT